MVAHHNLRHGALVGFVCGCGAVAVCCLAFRCLYCCCTASMVRVMLYASNTSLASTCDAVGMRHGGYAIGWTRCFAINDW